MKSLVVLCLVFVAVSALPAKKTEFDDSEESSFPFPMGKPHKKVPSVVEIEVGDSDEDTAFFPTYFRPLFINPFSFMNFGFSDFFSSPSWFNTLIPKGIPEDAIKNSTSSTKVVDGHKITVNETTYENEKNGAVYKFQIIDISPVDSKEKEDKPTIEDKTPKGPAENEAPELDTRTGTTEEVKPDQNSQDNEIHREEMLAKYELQGDDPSVYANDIETINFGQPEKRQNVVDLSSDTRVNRLLAENTRRGGLFMVPPEVEVFDTIDYDSLSANYQQNSSMDAQEIVKPQFNQEIIQPQFNQEIVRPQFNQETVRPQYNQATVKPYFATSNQYNQQQRVMPIQQRQQQPVHQPYQQQQQQPVYQPFQQQQQHQPVHQPFQQQQQYQPVHQPYQQQQQPQF